MLTRRAYKRVQKPSESAPDNWQERCALIEQKLFELADGVSGMFESFNRPGGVYITQAVVHPLSLNLSQGDDIASANSIRPRAGNRFRVTGTTQVNLISIESFPVGCPIITLHFAGSLTVAHNQAASGEFKPIMLSGAANFAATANDQLMLQYDTTDAKWLELARTVI